MKTGSPDSSETLLPMNTVHVILDFTYVLARTVKVTVIQVKKVSQITLLTCRVDLCKLVIFFSTRQTHS